MAAHGAVRTSSVEDDIDSRDKLCTCTLITGKPAGQGEAVILGPFSRVEDCPKHGIAASNARQNRYWQRVGRP